MRVKLLTELNNFNSTWGVIGIRMYDDGDTLFKPEYYSTCPYMSEIAKYLPLTYCLLRIEFSYPGGQSTTT